MMGQRFRVLLVTAAAAATTGCVSWQTCETSADCPGDGVCDEVERICAIRRDAGLGGDAGTGAGVDSGTDAGFDAGQPTPCAEGCARWQTCRPTTISNGECVNATIRALRPANGAHFTGGNPATFVFEVTQWDGGMWPGDVPFSMSDGMTGPTLLSKKTSTFEADVTLANRAGSQTVVAGWPAVDAGVTVVAEKCAIDCRPWEECVPDAANGTCRDLGLTLAFTAPSEGYEYGPISSGRVSLLLTATRADGGPFAAPIPFGLSDDATLRAWGELKKADKAWAGSVDAGADDGIRTLFAGWDGGPGTTTTFKVTATPPTITLTPETAPKRHESQTDMGGVPRWKKSEVAPVRVVSSRDLLAPPTPANFANTSVAASTRCTACAAPRCYCFEVDLAPQPFTQTPGTLYGTVPVSLNKPLTDVLGNSGTAEPAAFDVTRLKWSLDVSYGSAKTPTATALTTDGQVLVGVSAALTPPVAPSALTALNPDGGIAWQKSYGTEAITAGPMVGQMGIYFAVSTGTAGVLRKLALDGSGPTDRCTINGLSYVGDMALVSPGPGPGPSEYPMAVANDATLKGGTKATDSDCYASPPFWKDTLVTDDRPTVIVEGGVSYVALSSQPPIWKFDTLSTIPTGQGSRSTIGLFPSNLFLVGTNIVGGGGGPTVGGVFSFYDDGSALDGGATTNATPGSSRGGPAVVGPPDTGDSRPRVYYGDSDGSFRQVRLSPDNPPILDSASSTAATGVNLSKRAPVVGMGGHIYSAASGRLYVFDSTPTPEWYWNVPGAPAEAIAAQLNLDKNRDAAHPCAPGQPGVLYVVTTAGAQTIVYAILVDSQGIDANAPWPRYQHDPANTGNPGTSLGPWTCP